MSDYGKLWEEVAEIRRAIRKLSNGSARTDTFENAQIDIEAIKIVYDGLLEAWARLEKRMQQSC